MGQGDMTPALRELRPIAGLSMICGTTMKLAIGFALLLRPLLYVGVAQEDRAVLLRRVSRMTTLASAV